MLGKSSRLRRRTVAMRRYALLPIVVATASLRTAPPAAPPQRLFVAGLGYCGLRAARAFRAAYPACAIAGSARSEERAAALRRDHPWLDARVFDLDDAYRGLDGAGEAALGAATHVVSTMPPIADGDADPLLALHGLPDGCWAAYLSTTGVYQGSTRERNSQLQRLRSRPFSTRFG